MELSICAVLLLMAPSTTTERFPSFYGNWNFLSFVDIYKSTSAEVASSVASTLQTKPQEKEEK